MDLIAHVSQQFEESAQTKLQTIELLAPPIALAVETMTHALLGNGKILACGNGGAGAQAQHFAAQLVGRFERERPELAALALSSDLSAFTAVARDYGFDEIFAKQVRALGQPGDVLLVISSTGDSPNTLAAIEAAHQRDMRVVALTGRDGGITGNLLREQDIHLCVPHERTARIQEVHMLITHCLCDGIDCLLLGTDL